MKQFLCLIIFGALVLTSTLSCQRKIAKTDTDRMDEAIEYLDHGQAQEAINVLTPLTSHNKSPKLMSLLASAYLYRSNISTRAIIDLFLNFSIQNTKTVEPENEKLRDFTQMVAALDDFFLKLAMVPPINSQEQEADLNTALFYLKSAKPSTAGLALQRGLIRLILAKYIFTNTLENLLELKPNNQCEFSWDSFYKNMQSLLLVSEEIINDLKEANPKKAKFWNSSLESIDTTRKKIAATKEKEQPVDPLAQDLFIYFLKSHFIKVGCTP